MSARYRGAADAAASLHGLPGNRGHRAKQVAPSVTNLVEYELGTSPVA
jgi:hypothetical protein